MNVIKKAAIYEGKCKFCDVMLECNKKELTEKAINTGYWVVNLVLQADCPECNSSVEFKKKED